MRLQIPFPRSYLLECFDYRPSTGLLIWKIRPDSHFSSRLSAASFNTRCAGKVAGTKGSAPIQVKLDGRNYTVAHLIYAIMGEVIPEGMEIDHRNRNSHDNRWKNLRLATRAQNMWNTSKWTGKALPKGVSAVGYKGTNRFRARIRLNSKTIEISGFHTVEEAAEAYREMVENYRGKEFGYSG